MAYSEGVPPQQYLLMVQANELVPVNRKISAVAGSLEELEATLARELGIAMQVGVCLLADAATNTWVQVPSLAQMPAKAKVRVAPLQPRGPSAEEQAAARARVAAFKLKQTEEETRMMEEKIRMKEREFEVQRQLQILEAKKRALLQQRAQAAAPAPAAPPGSGIAFNLLVQESELVKNKQRVSVTAATLTQLEAALQAELNLQIDISVFVDGQAATAIEAVPPKGKIEVRKRVAQVIEVAAAGKDYKLLISENDMVAQQFKVKVTANSMEELEEAIAAKAQAAGMEIDRNFVVCPWDDDFDEFIDGVKWKDFPQTGKVELRPKAAMEIEAAEAIAQANARAAEAEAKIAEAQALASEERKAQKAQHEEEAAARMGEAMAAAEAKMREMERAAQEREAELLRKEKEAEERAAQKEKEAEERAAQKEREAQQRIEEIERRQKEKLDKQTAELQAQTLANIEKAKAEAAERKAKQEEEDKAAAAAALGGYADAQSAVDKLTEWMEKEIDKDGDKVVAALLDDVATATHPDIVEARKKLTSYRKSERERRKRDFFAAKRAKEADDSTQAAVNAAKEFNKPDSADSTPSASDAGANEAARQTVAKALVSGKREAMEAALADVEGVDELAEDAAQLKQRLGEVVRVELQAGLTMDDEDTIDDLIALAETHNQDALGKELEERKAKVVKVNRLLKAAERTTDKEQVQEALTAARELGAFEALCKQVEVAHGLREPEPAEGEATAEPEPASEPAPAADGEDVPPNQEAAPTAVVAKKTATATKKKVTATATKKKVTATATKKTATATAVSRLSSSLASFSPVCLGCVPNCVRVCLGVFQQKKKVVVAAKKKPAEEPAPETTD